MIIGIPVYDKVDMLDVTGPYEMFDWAGYEIDLLAEHKGMKQFRSKGFCFDVTKSFADARAMTRSGFPAGTSTRWRASSTISSEPISIFWSRRRRARRWCVRSAKAQCCWRPPACWTSITRRRTGPSFHVSPNASPRYWSPTDTPRFVLDRDRLTGGGISSGLDEALMLIQLLEGTVAAQKVQQNVQYYPDPPVNSAIPEAPAHCPLPRGKN